MSFMPYIVAFPAPAALSPLRRPALLIRAGRHGAGLFRRDRDLPRLLGHPLPAAGRALPRLRAIEDEVNEARKQGRADYDLSRHILLLAAILAEMRLTDRAVPVAALRRG